MSSVFGFCKLHPILGSWEEDHLMQWICGGFSRNLRELLELTREKCLGREGRFTSDFPYPFVRDVGVIWEFPKIRGPYFGVLIIRVLLCRVLY